MNTWNRAEGDRVKVIWSGKVISAQPHIRLTRSFDQRSHTYLGYTLTVQGSVGREERTFAVGIGKGLRPSISSERGMLLAESQRMLEIPKLRSQNTTRPAN